MRQRETELSNLIRLEASKLEIRLWRNNNGAVHTNDGRFIRFGLANDTAEINKVLKSSDLIGIRPITITQDMVGKTIGQFICREVKHSGWSYTETERHRAQLNWINLINSLGGNACFTTGVGSFK